MRILLNALGYQAVWFLAVIGAARGQAGWGVAAAAAFVAGQGLASRERAADLLLLAVAVAFGVVVDGMLALSGWLQYATPRPALVAPAWILAIWAAFALTFNHSLRFLQGRPWWAAAVGAVGGPSAYLAAAHGFDAVAFAAPAGRKLLMLAVVWAVAMPVLGELALAWRLALHPAREERE